MISGLENYPYVRVTLYCLTCVGIKKSSICEVGSVGWVLEFKERLHGIIRLMWYELEGKQNNVALADASDLVIWKWIASKNFLVKSVYEHLTSDDSGPNYKRIWKAKIPEKIKVFMWLVEQGAILTKDNMVKRRWQGNPAVCSVGTLNLLIIFYLLVL
jgi:hypothetical protein